MKTNKGIFMKSTLWKNLRGMGTLVLFSGWILTAASSYGQIPEAGTRMVSISPDASNVVFYPDRAMVARKINVELEEGRNLLVFKNAPVAMEKDTLRAFSENKAIAIQSIHTWTEKTTRSDTKEIRDLETQIKELEYRGETQKSEKKRFLYAEAILGQMEDFLSFYVSRSNEAASGDKKAKEWETASQFILEKRVSYRKELEKIENNLKENAEDIAIVRQKLADIQSGYDKTIRTIEIRVIAEKKTNAEITLAYVTMDARWSSAYAFYLEDNPSSLKMVYYADLYQKTGEDWKNISVELSTTFPSLGADRPSLYSLYISGRKIKKQTTDYYSADKTTEETGGTAEKDSGEEKSDEYRFSIPHKVSIGSKDQTFRLKVQSTGISKFSLHYRVFPAKSRYAHIIGVFRNQTEIPFLGGSADLYRNGSYAGNTRLDYTPKNAEINLGFGMDRNVEIIRNHRKYQEDTGLLTSGVKFRLTYDTNIVNHSSSIRDVYFYERLPVSETEAVKTQLLKNTTSGYEIVKNHPGVHLWKLSMPKSGTRDIHFEYTMEGPSNFDWDMDN